ncbi:chemotaxis protein CheD [Aerolutibacter ruishenii]|uniref:chemotaxis protein CheD n=1 Tax=Aerolutibacter ruishenii TaxID=686800 RepID=UPI0018F5311B|nr:chemotaxis protein CheD [Lysobacter ruishenii]
MHLQPAQVWFGGGAVQVRTILGSCVAITLWHPQRRIGGMCHFMLPEHVGRQLAAPDPRYATDAVRLLLREVQASGCRASEFEAKLFGGGRMFHGGNGNVGVQERNVDMARKLMSSHGFQVKAEHLGGYGHRQVLFDVASGDAWLKHTPLPPPAMVQVRGAA